MGHASLVETDDIPADVRERFTQLILMNEHAEAPGRHTLAEHFAGIYSGTKVRQWQERLRHEHEARIRSLYPKETPMAQSETVTVDSDSETVQAVAQQASVQAQGLAKLQAEASMLREEVRQLKQQQQAQAQVLASLAPVGVAWHYVCTNPVASAMLIDAVRYFSKSAPAPLYWFADMLGVQLGKNDLDARQNLWSQGVTG